MSERHDAGARLTITRPHPRHMRERGLLMISSHPSPMCGVSDYTGQLLRRVSAEMPVRNMHLDARRGAFAYVHGVVAAMAAVVRMRPRCLHLQYTPTTSGPLAPVLLLWARLAGRCGVVISAHERPSTYERKLPRIVRLAFRLFERAVYGQAAHVVVFSRVHADELRARFGIDAEVMPLGIEPAENATRAITGAGSAPIITFAGFVRPAKGLDDLVAAAPLIGAALGRCRIRIIGATTARDAPYAAGLRERAAAVSDSAQCSIEVTGEVAASEYQRLMAEADLFVFPFRTVSQSITLSEVVALGTPVVTSDIGGVGDTVRDHGIGLTCPAGDAPALASAVIRMLTDRGLYEDCRAHVLSYARQADWRTLAAQHVEIYRELAT